MKLSEKSQLQNNIHYFNIDNRISKFEIQIEAATNRFGQRISPSPGHSSVTVDRRHYLYGDQFKDIDWKLTAKTDKLYTKIRESYKQARIYSVIDNSGSMRVKYNSSISKLDMALLITYILGVIALKEHDNIFIFHNNYFEKIKNTNELLNILIELELSDSSFDWESVLELKKGYLFFLSDFFVSNNVAINFFKNILAAGSKIIATIIKDYHEEKLDFKGIYNFLDPEVKSKSVLSNTASIKNLYLKDYKNHFSNLHSEFHSLKLHYSNIYSSMDPINEFLRINI